MGADLFLLESMVAEGGLSEPWWCQGPKGFLDPGPGTGIPRPRDRGSTLGLPSSRAFPAEQTTSGSTASQCRRDRPPAVKGFPQTSRLPSAAQQRP